jgi:hypothetical protein
MAERQESRLSATYTGRGLTVAIDIGSRIGRRHIGAVTYSAATMRACLDMPLSRRAVL